MKKQLLFLIPLAALLSITACGGNNNDSKPSESTASIASSSEPEPEVGLTDCEKPNMELDFQEVERTCMVEDEIKNYVDAMEAQEKTLEKPYHFSPLYGPSDYSVLGSKPEKVNNANYGRSGKEYPSNETGGVDACQYLKEQGGKDKNVPIVVKWDASNESYDENTKVKFWSTKDFSDLRETSVTVNDGVASVSLANLFVATKYRIQVFNGDDVSQGFEFDTADYPRTMSMGDIPNVRDIGGYMTSYGVRTNQGLIYRGFEIEDKEGGHGVKYNAKCEAVHQEVMKIGYEIDLRKSTELNGRTASALGPIGEGDDAKDVSYKCLTLVSYENFLKEDSYKNLPEVFSIIANADERHVYFHCWGGADRTGMLAFFINAICGVSYTDLIEDFEITSETNNMRCHLHNSSSARYATFLNAFANEWTGFDASETINENCYKWLVEVAEVNPDVIEDIRQIMIPGYYADMPQNIPTYTASEGTEEDEFGIWNPAVEDSNVRCNYKRKDELLA